MQVSMYEAAQQLNVSVDTIRRRLSNGELNEILEPTPQGYRWKIDLPEDSSNATTDARVDANLTEAALAITEMQARIASLEAQLGVKDTQIDQLHRLLATTALNAAPARPWWKVWERKQLSKESNLLTDPLDSHRTSLAESPFI